MVYLHFSFYYRREITRIKKALAKDEQEMHEIASTPVQPPDEPEQLVEFIRRARISIATFKNTLKSRLDAIEELKKKWTDAVRPLEGERLDAAVEDFARYFEDATIQGGAVDQVLEAVEDTMLNLDQREIELKSLEDARLVAPASRAPPAAPPANAPYFKAPKLDLPKFDGNPLKFENFMSVFEDQVHKDGRLTAVQKFITLKNLLTGKAFDFLDPMRVTEANYPTAIKELKGKFGSKRLLETSFMNMMRTIPKASMTANACRKTLDRIRLTVSEITSMQTGAQGLTMMELVEAKFPDPIVNKTMEASIEAEKSGAAWNLEKLLEALEVEVRKLELWEAKGRRHQPADDEEETANFAVMSGGRQWTCLFCDRKGHFSKECRTVRKAADRKEIFRSKKKCFRCARNFHGQCTATCTSCQGRHHQLLCPDLETKRFTTREPQKEFRSRTEKQKIEEKPRAEKGSTPIQRKPKKAKSANVNLVEDEPQEEAQVNATAETTRISDKEPDRPFVILACTAAKVANSSKKVQVFLDTGSQRSFILNEIADQLGLKTIGHEVIQLKVFGRKAVPKPVRVMELTLETANGRPMTFQVRAVEEMTSEFSAIPLTHKDKKFMSAMNIKLADPERLHKAKKPDILLGADYFWSLMTWTAHHELPSGLHAISTVFGTMLTGPIHGKFSSTTAFSVNVHPVCDVDDFFKLEAIGISDREEENQLSLASYVKTIEEKDGEYELKLPFKPTMHKPALNLNLAFRRLENLFKKYSAQPKIWEAITNIIKDQQSKKILESAPHDPFSDFSQGGTYLPWSVVITPEKSTKARIVYDASAHTRGTPSLNDCLDPGPCLIPHLIGCLLRVRVHAYFLCADVEKAFLQLRLAVESRDFTRFLWLLDPKKPPTPENIIVLRFTRVPFGLNSSPFMLAATIFFHLSKFGEKIREEFMANTYVDNVFLGADNKMKLIEKYRLAKEAFTSLRMNLRDFSSNCPEVQAAIDPMDRDPREELKILGLPWGTKEDIFSLRVTLPSFEKWSKRTVLKATSTTFDPLGIFVPVLLKAKLFLQDLWKQKKEWDEPLDQENLEEWIKIREETEGAATRLPRRYALDVGEKPTLCVFTDASTRAYGAVVYLKTTAGISFMMAKSRLAPIEGSTVPRLELLAILAGLQLVRMIKNQLKNELEIKEAHVFSDSKIALSWTRGQGKWKPFVENRVRTIQKIVVELDVPVRTHYVATDENPADCATRGLTAHEFSKHFWLSGPVWLKQVPDKWPNINESLEITSEEDPEALPKKVCCICTTQQAEEAEWESQRGFKRSRFDFAVFLRFIKFSFRNQLPQKLKDAIPELDMLDNSPGIQAKDLKAAEIVLWKRHQKKWLTEKLLKSSTNLIPFKDEDGLWKCRGRLGNSELPVETKFPVLTCSEAPIVRNYIELKHREQKHAGVEQTLNETRKKIWMQKGRQTVRKVLGRCVICRKKTSLQMSYPQEPHLPAARVRVSRPFAHCGIDHLGPLKIVSEENNNKAYVLLFTCLATRAVHLEITLTTSTDEVLKALKRFCARRGVPETILSDNAPCFKLTADTLHSLSSTTDLQLISWSFNTPYASWRGGSWERIVGSVKTALIKSTGRHPLPLEEFTTAITEIEGMINNRPLTRVPEGAEGDVLRPIDFLCPNVRVDIPTPEIERDQPYQMLSSAEEAVDRMQKTTEALDAYWKQWQNEYLTALRETHKRRNRGREGPSREPKVNEIVLITNPQLPRSHWPMARIEELHRGKDGAVRTVTLRLPSKRLGEHKRVQRAVCQLIPLELSAEDPLPELPKRKVEEQIPVEPKQEQRSQGKEEPKLRRSERLKGKRKNYRVPDSDDEDENVLTATTSSPSRWFPSTAFAHLLLLLSLIGTTTGTEMKCVKGGVQILSNFTPAVYQICSTGLCVTVEAHSAETTQLLSPEIVLSDHTIKLSRKPIDSEDPEEETHIHCPATPFCEQIICYFCFSLITNPSCWPTWSIIGLILLSGSTLGILCGFCLLFKWTFAYIRYIARQIARPFLFCIRKPLFGACNLLPTFWSRRANRRTNGQRRSILSQVTTWDVRARLSLAVIAVLLGLAQSCQDVYTVTLNEEVCKEVGNETLCHIEHSKNLFLNSLRQESCVRVKSQDETVVSEIKIRLKKITLHCYKTVELYSRDVQLLSRFHKADRATRNEICKGINSSSVVDELENANNLPGWTGCLPVEALIIGMRPLYYRVYAEHTTDVIYEFFSCSQWRASAVVDVTTTSDKEVKSEQLLLHHNQEEERENFSLALLNYATPTIRGLSSTFLTKDAGVAVVKDSFKSTISCPNKEAAQKMTNCSANEDACDCKYVYTMSAFSAGHLHCRCAPANPEEEFRDPERILPITAPGITFRSTLQKESRSIEVDVFHDVSTQLLLKFTTTVKTVRLTKEESCEIATSNMRGCYSCERGAATNMTCQSRNSSVVAEVSCGSQSFALPCIKEGATSEIRLFFDSATINQECSYSCGGKEKRAFKLDGTLYYVASPLNWQKLWKIIDTHRNSTETGNFVPFSLTFPFDLPDLWFMFNFLSDNWKTLLIALAGVGIALLLIYTLGPMILPLLLRPLITTAVSATRLILMFLFRILFRLLSSLRTRKRYKHAGKIV